MKFRKKPVVIEATQWFTHGDHPAVVPIPYDHPTDGRAIRPAEWGWLRTLESGHGGQLVQPGDWIITGVQGEFYPIKDAIFRETYDAVDAGWTDESDDAMSEQPIAEREGAMTITQRNLVLKFAYHWCREYLTDQRIENVRRVLRELRRRLDVEHPQVKP